VFSPTLVHDYLSLSARGYPEKVAVASGTERLTYRSLDRLSDELAGFLSQVGVKRHDRVVVFMDNCIESVVALYGILKAGAAFVILNGTIKPKRLSYILNDSGAAAVVTHTAKARVIQEALVEVKNLVTLLWVGDPSKIPTGFGKNSSSWVEIANPAEGHDLGSGSRFKEIRAAIIDQDLAALIYTSGSTGEPKGVMSTHHNMVSAARSIIQYIGNRPDDIIIEVLPLSFDYGLYQVLMSVMIGATAVFESFLFPVKVLQRIEADRVTGFPMVPTIASLLLKMQDLGKYDLSSIRYMTNTGAALPVEHIRKIRALFPDVRFYSMFGLTECKRTLYLPPEEVDRRPASVGKAIPNCEVFVLDENGNEVATGEVGELVIRGSNVMRGYWNAPELTARAYRPGKIPGEAWLYSGDYFRKDEEGYLYFLGRKDDMIKTRGERVSPKEMENVLSGMPGVEESAVMGVPDEMLGEAIKVFLVAMPGSTLTDKDLLRFCSENFESYMQPKYIVFLAELPKSKHGKIDKAALRDMEVH